LADESSYLDISKDEQQSRDQITDIVYNEKKRP